MLHNGSDTMGPQHGPARIIDTAHRLDIWPMPSYMQLDWWCGELIVID